MAKKKSPLKIAQEKAETALNKTNDRIEFLGEKTDTLYKALTDLQSSFDKIRNVPNDKKIEYEKLALERLNWKQQAEKIEKDYEEACLKDSAAATTGAGVGIAVVTLGPTAAMGIATTFGVASTGTAISTLSGAAATNAALAWLGGGALITGGGGMAAGNALLTLAGPVGWAIAGISLISSGLLLLKAKADKKRLEALFQLISERDVKSYDLAIVELNERITRIIEDTSRLKDAIKDIETFGLDYTKMSEQQQYTLGTYVNLMAVSTRLLIDPILGLQSKYSENDYDTFATATNTESPFKNIIISLANLLYKIELDGKDKTLLYKSLKKNKEFLASTDIKKKDFKVDILDTVSTALEYKYNN